VTTQTSIAAEMGRRVGSEDVFVDRAAQPFLRDATEACGLERHAVAVVLPGTTDELAAVVAWCGDRGAAVTPRGGRTGYAGGAVPHGGVVAATERLRRARAFEPLHSRGGFEAGVTTATVRRLARERGLASATKVHAAPSCMSGTN
jgi:FAD/FMN-containing dehydrogenase